MAEAADKSGDLLLYLAAGVVALMGLAWLVIEAPWSSSVAEDMPELPAPDVATPAADVPQATPVPAAATAAPAASPADDPLRLARLALDAGMLLEPVEYSAWMLFGAAVAADPANREARAGLDETASRLLDRGNAALEQGRYDDASTIAETILARLPGYAGAETLIAEIALATAPPAAAPEPLAPAVTPVDTIADLNADFFAAMAANNVLTPPGSSAIDLVGEMLEQAPTHELTVAARELLVTEMLDRSAQSIEARDATAARTWIDAASRLGTDPARLRTAEERLADYLVAAETRKLLPASDFVQTHYVKPDYPRFALNRGVEGWVDVEFLITEQGQTENIQVIDASNDRYFREEAVAAVEQWRFEPDTFMGRPIARRSFARIAFVLD